jgi:DNA invertase Pin-like site-specific DNA recombinase
VTTVFALAKRPSSFTGLGERAIMMGVFAEFERANIVERDNAGLAQAKAEGRRRGRPTLPAANEDIVWRRPAGGTGAVKAAPLACIGVSAVQRIPAAIATAA